MFETENFAETESEAVHAKLEEATALPGVSAEICGSWVWVTGNTKPVKEALKGLGFRWSPRKTAWYWHEGKYRRFHKRHFTMNEIRMMHGSETLAEAA